MPTHHTSNLAGMLENGHFVITAEIAPPHGVDIQRALSLAAGLSSHVHAFNITDNQNARLRLSPLAFCHRMIEEGHEVIYQLTCRDRNRLALQSDLLGAWSLGIRNVLALTGDHVTAGDHPDAAPVFDLDSIQLLSVISRLNSGQDLAGKQLDGSPVFYPGAALACDRKPLDLTRIRFRKKVHAGARFFQTQALFKAASLEPFLAMAEEQGVFIVAGILLLHSRSMVNYINRKVPGLQVPRDVMNRIEAAQDPVEAGIEEAIRLIRECRSLCHGFHFMTAGRDDLLLKLLDRADLS